MRQLHHHDFETDSHNDELSIDADSVVTLSVDMAIEEEIEKQQGLADSLARKETRAVRSLRVLIFIVLIVVATLASVLVYMYSQGTEKQEFRNEFTAQGLKVIAGFQGDSFRKLQAMDSLSSSLTSYALESKLQWPFVTIPNSAHHLEPYLSLANAASLLLMPIIKPRQRSEWEAYSVANQGWIEEDLASRAAVDPNELARQQEHGGERRDLVSNHYTNSINSTTTAASLRNLLFNKNSLETSETKISWFIKNYVGIDTTPGDWIVWWQYAPVIPNRWFVNFNRLALENFDQEVKAVKKQSAVLSTTWTFEPGLDFQSTRDFDFTMDLLSAGGQDYEPGEPLGYIHYPVFDTFDTRRETVAILTATVYWKSYFQNILPNSVKGILCVVESSLGQSFTYQIDGKEARFLGMTDLHDRKYTGFGISADYSSFTESSTSTPYTGVPVDDNFVSYRIHVYPSAQFEDSYVTQKPVYYATAMLSVFLFTTLIFLMYDCYVERRQRIVMSTAVKSDAVVTSLFPENVRERLMEQAAQQQRTGIATINPGEKIDIKSSKPIADFFPETTIMFADIRGFTAWSSVREPTQVFILLETLYNAFDRIAKSRRVFKVETIGDCYVAVAGLPEPRKDHAVAMARFASKCLEKVHVLTRELELELGPGTADLTMRFGLHSGPVTAGVLRGEKSRFQLFGDTMNTAARMESTSLRARIQVSEETANLLRVAGKGRWLHKREEKVMAKGKGEMQTYWLQVTTMGASSSGDISHGGSMSGDGLDTDLDPLVGANAGEDCRDNEKLRALLSNDSLRLINWNVEVLRKLLKQIVARREAVSSSSENGAASAKCPNWYKENTTGTVLDEVREIITLPAFDSSVIKHQKASETVTLSEEVENELHDYVTSIAGMYRQNPFHNLEHASHVTMSVSKLLSRIVAPTDLEFSPKSSIQTKASTLHDYTYGITSDPLTQFACVFSALIHDVDHTGVPNTQLQKEHPDLARMYRNQSIAEQNSVDLAWSLLFHPDYDNLRATIYNNQAELERFRRLVVNSVMATDIMDKDLKVLRNARWDKAFAGEEAAPRKQWERDNVNRKATIVIEHLIQASDVAHTMQHWHVYRKWNEELFREMSLAYHSGRAERDPADNWYKGELGFFDFYIIPLAKKLKNCGVFGVSSDEYLKYAENNRREWEEKGESIVAEMVERVRCEGVALGENVEI